MTTPSCARAALLILFMSSAAFAQAEPAPTPAPNAQPVLAAGGAARTYTAADFTRFAPRNAYDMLSNVPGFAIDQSTSDRRGLGQATGNVLINGERFSGKSTDILTELRRISASNVARIEIVDAATLNVSGLSGQVANVITVSRGLSGNFVYRPQIRAHRTPFRYTNGEISVNGSVGATQYTLSLRNDSQRNGNAGPELVTTPDGTLLDTRDEVLSFNVDQPRLSATIHRAFAGGAILNVNAAGGFRFQDVHEVSLRHGAGQPDRNRNLKERTREYDYELGGDYEFGLGGGRLKLIGLRHFTHTPFRQTLIQTYADLTPTIGQRFTQVGDQTETIGRGEYRWHGGGADWQVSLEGALNRLDVDNGLFSLDGAGDFVPLPFPNSAATVEERRGEAMLTYGRPIASNLNLQASIGGEYSQLSQNGAGGLTRIFYRPKGFVNLAWQPRPGLDLSARIERAVGQLDFFDFVASGNISAGTQNAGNANLVPPQSWDGQVQAVRNLGRWGNATARLYGRLISDIVDVIPVNGGQSPGNLPGTATVYGIQWTSTFNFDPIGVPGAKLDLGIEFRKSRLTDPLTGARRSINENMTRQITATFRHDIPHTPFAYGAEYVDFRQSPLLRLDQHWHYLTRPGTLGVYVEHKDIFGLTMRATVDNLLGTNESFGRRFYDGLRTNGVLFTENRDRFYGPIFTLTISGTI
jgi:outer membrane receptor for ferrienterochelin and colicins